MRKICVFTQTYSNHRLELFEWHNKDKDDIRFRNNFDLSLYSFHNCDSDYINSLLNFEYFKNIKNLKKIQYDNISYTQSLKKTLNYLKSEGFSHIIFLQDDCLTKSDMMEELIFFIRNENFDMLNLEQTPITMSKENPEIIFLANTFQVYNTNTKDFARKWGAYCFDDGPYVANIDFLLNNVYDEQYFNIGDVWGGENYLAGKITANPIKRLTTNFSFYYRYNIVGANTWNRDVEIENLKLRFG